MIRLRVILAQTLLFAASAGAATIDLAKWQYFAEVTIEDGRSEYCAFALTPEVYSVARSDFADIRLIESDGRQIPYILTREEDAGETFKYGPTILNRSTDAAGNALLTLDFGGQTIKNCIEVKTSGNNFRRAVKVEGSNDNVQFFTVVERAYVFAVSDRDYHRFSKIDLPSNDYRYLRICVSPMAAEEEKIAVNQVSVSKVDRKTAQRQVVEMMQTEHSENEKTSSSAYIYDLKYRHLPIVEIELDVEEAAFYRCVTILGRDAATEKVKIDSEDSRQRFTEVEVPWNMMTTDAIYRYAGPGGEERRRLVLPVRTGGSYRYLKVVVNNYDDGPITIRSASAKMIRHKVVFPAFADKSLRIYVGCESAGQPRYDLARRINKVDELKTTAAGIAALTDNPLFRKAAKGRLPWTEQHRALLLVVLSAVVLVLGVFMVKSLKSIQNQTGGAK